ncbi:MAG: hypothetical protein ABI396_19385 [Ktedonobacteraceae bacterium]
MTRIRDFKGHLRPLFFFRRSHLFGPFYSQKLEHLFLKRATMALLLKRFSELEVVSSLVVWSICRYSDRELLASLAFSMMQYSMKEVFTIKRETTGTNGPQNHESLSYPRYAYGFGEKWRNGKRIVGHTGGFPGISTHFEFSPESGEIIVALSNYDPPITDHVANALWERLDHL